jgi:hypothetical protein
MNKRDINTLITANISEIIQLFVICIPETISIDNDAFRYLQPHSSKVVVEICSKFFQQHRESESKSPFQDNLRQVGSTVSGCSSDCQRLAYAANLS